jgi:hypothetical protein
MKRYKVSDYDMLVPSQASKGWQRIREKLGFWFWAAVVIAVLRAAI